MGYPIMCILICLIICTTIIILNIFSKPKKEIQRKVDISNKTKYDVCNLIIYTDGSLNIEYYNYDSDY